jgi:beta-phosphoglucomutase-like phosphatase (HAD superfamily)
MEMRFGGIAWDVDGTLADSEPRHHRALLAASRRWGVDLSALPEAGFRGLHNADVWETLRPRFPASLARDTWLDAIDDAYVDDDGPIHPMPGALDAMRSLNGWGIGQVCVSNSNRRIVTANLAALGVQDLVAGIVGLDDVAAGKPDPTPYRTGCALLRLPPGRVGAGEDSATGVAAARAAGLFVVGFAGPGTPAPAGADLVTDDLRDVLGLFVVNGG